MHNFKSLMIWKRSMELAKQVYLLTKGFPSEETYGITSQIRKCLYSIPANIAEGSATGTNKGFNRYLEISIGSAFELETLLLLLSLELGFTKNTGIGEILTEINEIQQMIHGFQKKLFSS